MGRYGDTAADKVLSNMAQAYHDIPEEELISTKTPTVLSDTSTGEYVEFEKGTSRRIVEDGRADGTVPKDIDAFSAAKIPYAIEDRALSGKYSWKEVNDAETVIKHDERITRKVTRAVLRGREHRLQNIIFNPATFPNTSAAATKWDDAGGTTIDPRVALNPYFSEVEVGCGARPNAIFLGGEVYNFLRIHPALSGYLSDSKDKNITKEVIRNYFDVQFLFIGAEKYNSEKEGQTSSMGYVWGKHALVAYINPSSTPNVNDPSLFYTLSYNMTGSTKSPNFYSVQKTMLKREKKTIIDVDTNYLHKLTYPSAGYLSSAVIA